MYVTVCPKIILFFGRFQFSGFPVAMKTPLGRWCNDKNQVCHLASLQHDLLKTDQSDCSGTGFPSGTLPVGISCHPSEDQHPWSPWCGNYAGLVSFGAADGRIQNVAPSQWLEVVQLVKNEAQPWRSGDLWKYPAKYLKFFFWISCEFPSFSTIIRWPNVSQIYLGFG